MIETIRNIGRYSLKKQNKKVEEPLQILIDDPETNHNNPKYKHILFILIEKTNSKYDYTGIEEEEYSKGKLDKYLYKQGSSRGTDLSPTARITRVDTEGDQATTFELKILKWFEDNQDINSNINFYKIYNCLENNKNKIQNELKEKYNLIDTNEKGVISVKIDKKYIGEIQIFKNIIIQSSKEKYYTKYGKQSKQKNGICFVCGNKKNEVYGYVITFPFSGFDKKGFVSGGFRQEEAWKSYPVCLQCALELETGKKYLKEFLQFNFYGFKYHLIPKFINKNFQKDIFTLIEDWKNPNFKKKEINRLTEDENEILEILSEKENYLNMNFLFYEVPRGYDGAEFKILLYIEDILPSNLKKLFEIKKYIDNIDIFKNFKEPIFQDNKKIGEKSLEFNFSCVRRFFKRFNDNRSYDKYFLEIVNKIFTLKKIDYYFLITHIIYQVRDEFITKKLNTLSTLKGFMLLNFLNKLNILNKNREIIDMDEEKIEIKHNLKKEIENFFKMFPDFFNNPSSKVSFLMGVLAQFLLNIQYQERNATPFRNKLKGLKLDEFSIKKLFPEIQNKLEEYNKNYYRQLEEIISSYFLNSGDNWKLTKDEISFYFVLGMNLSNNFKTK